MDSAVAGDTPDDPTLRAAKAKMRRTALAGRVGLDPLLGVRLADHVLAGARPPTGAVIAGYAPIGTEIDPRPLLAALERRGHTLVLPVTPPRGQALRFRRWRFGAPLATGVMGTRHPADGEWLDPDWLLVPLLAFDRAGRRLGYGGGYYDRSLAGLPAAIAVGAAFAAQEVPLVPAGPHDIRLALVATETGLIATGA